MNAAGGRPVDASSAGTSRTQRILAGVSLAAFPAALFAARVGAPLPPCPFKALTGLDCPGCGTGRALGALAEGDLAAVLDHNLLLPVVGPLLAVSLLAVAAGRAPLLGRHGWSVTALILVTGFWALRLLPFETLSYLDSGPAR